MLAQGAPAVLPPAKQQHDSESAGALNRLGHDAKPRPTAVRQEVDRPAAGAKAVEAEARAAKPDAERVAQLRREMKLAAAVEDFARAAQLQVELRALASSTGENGQEAAASCAAPTRTAAAAKPAAAKPAAAKPAAAKPNKNRPCSQGKEQPRGMANVTAKGATT